MKKLALLSMVICSNAFAYCNLSDPKTFRKHTELILHTDAKIKDYIDGPLLTEDVERSFQSIRELIQTSASAKVRDYVEGQIEFFRDQSVESTQDMEALGIKTRASFLSDVGELQKKYSDYVNSADPNIQELGLNKIRQGYELLLEGKYRNKTVDVQRTKCESHDEAEQLLESVRKEIQNNKSGRLLSFENVLYKFGADYKKHFRYSAVVSLYDLTPEILERISKHSEEGPWMVTMIHVNGEPGFKIQSKKKVFEEQFTSRKFAGTKVRCYTHTKPHFDYLVFGKKKFLRDEVCDLYSDLE